jgi:hypothetical protein
MQSCHFFLLPAEESLQVTCEYPPPAAPPLIPNVGPWLGCLKHAMTFLLRCAPKACVSPTWNVPQRCGMFRASLRAGVTYDARHVHFGWSCGKKKLDMVWETYRCRTFSFAEGCRGYACHTYVLAVWLVCKPVTYGNLHFCLESAIKFQFLLLQIQDLCDLLDG